MDKFPENTKVILAFGNVNDMVDPIDIKDIIKPAIKKDK